MKQITTSKGTFIFVEVPDGICHTDLVYYGTMPAIEFRVIATQNIGHVELPRGVNYNFICTTSNATEEHAEMVVDVNKNYNTMYRDYQCDDWACIRSVSSLYSLMISEELNSNKNYAILKQI